MDGSRWADTKVGAGLGVVAGRSYASDEKVQTDAATKRACRLEEQKALRSTVLPTSGK